MAQIVTAVWQITNYGSESEQRSLAGLYRTWTAAQKAIDPVRFLDDGHGVYRPVSGDDYVFLIEDVPVQ